MTSRIDGPASLLFRPVDGAGVAVFRMFFGGILATKLVGEALVGGLRERYLEPAFHFKYLGFGWVEAPSWVVLLYLLVALAALGVALGLYHRASAALFTLGFTWIFLLEKSDYLNHFYFVILVGALLVLVPAQRSASLDARRRPCAPVVPLWALAALRFQVAAVYVGGGVAKLNSDWLQGEPIRTWLASRTHVPVIGSFFTQEWVVYAFAWGGTAFDLLVVPMLMWRRTRALAFAWATVFHLTNTVLFSIGVFPWVTLAASTLFFDPGWPRRLGFGRRRPTVPVTAEPYRAAPGAAAAALPTRAARRLLLGLLGVHFTFQVLLPLRHFLYPGNVSWTEEGHNFAWHMKLRDKNGFVQFVAHDPESGDQWVIDPTTDLTPRQVRKMTARPDLILQYAHELARRQRAQGRPRVEVHANTRVSLNGRPHQELIDLQVDLAVQPRNLTHATWIVPLEYALDDPGP